MKRRREERIIPEEHARLLDALEHVNSTSHSVSLPRGCGIRRSIPAYHLEALSLLSDDIIAQVNDMAPWSEGMQDDRKRCYGFISEFSKWEGVKQLCDAGIVLDAEPEPGHDAGNNSINCNNMDLNCNTDIAQLSQKHHYTVKNCCTTLSLTTASKKAIEYVIAEARSILEANVDHLEPYELQSLSLRNLAAIQPNVHNNSAFLPLHLDQPRYDGFGVVIVTVGLAGSGEIILVDEGDGESSNDESNSCANANGGGRETWAFPLDAGDMYVLSGPARNLCLHGVLMSTIHENEVCGEILTKKLADTSPTRDSIASKRAEAVDRVSLNLRFGVHTPQQAYESIDKHWK